MTSLNYCYNDFIAHVILVLAERHHKFSSNIIGVWMRTFFGPHAPLDIGCCPISWRGFLWMSSPWPFFLSIQQILLPISCIELFEIRVCFLDYSIFIGAQRIVSVKRSIAHPLTIFVFCFDRQIRGWVGWGVSIWLQWFFIFKFITS